MMQPADTPLTRTDGCMNRLPRAVSWTSREQLPQHLLRRRLGGVVASCWFRGSCWQMPCMGCPLESVKVLACLIVEC